jgi:hypothetical protein
MTTVPDEAAFPVIDSDAAGDIYVAHDGLTKREYFAAMVAKGLANENWVPVEIAQMSVATADQLIAALNAEGQANG